MSIEAYYGDWRRYNELIVRALRTMTAEELGLRADRVDPSAAAHWPIWAIAGHMAGTRVFWLCDVMGEPGAKGTPFTDAASAGWEDDLDCPRSGEELASAWEATWAIVGHALATWTPSMLDEVVTRDRGTRIDRFTRRSLVLRMIIHEGYHAGEIALIQGIHGRPQIDLWPQGWHTVDAIDWPQDG
ncbi:MAG TPA: DinB family protein [Candidatus Limnocylindrales bacterium]